MVVDVILRRRRRRNCPALQICFGMLTSLLKGPAAATSIDMALYSPDRPLVIRAPNRFNASEERGMSPARRGHAFRATACGTGLG